MAEFAGTLEIVGTSVGTNLTDEETNMIRGYVVMKAKLTRGLELITMERTGENIIIIIITIIIIKMK